MKDTIEKRVVQVFTLIFLVIVVVAVVSIRNIGRSIEGSDWVNHTHAVMIEADAVLSSLYAGDSSLRSYLLTGDKRDQTAYRQAYTSMVEHLNVGQALTQSEPEHAQFLELQKLIAKRVAFTKSVVQSREQSGMDAASMELAADSGSGQIEAIAHIVAKLNAQENQLLKERDKESFLQAHAVRWTIFAGVAVNLVLLAFVGWVVRDDIAARRRAATAMAEANAQLEAKVQERTADLVKANSVLKQENLERRWAFQAQTHQLRYNDLIFNSIGELVFVVSKTLTVSRINPSVTHKTGYAAPELIGSPLEKALQVAQNTEKEVGLTQNPILLALKEGREIQERPGILIDKAQHATPVFFNVVPIRDQNKVVGGIVTVSPHQDGLRKAQ